jgi:murein DD-endopeptidase MepM/ murein hydrolase activator NlpD
MTTRSRRAALAALSGAAAALAASCTPRTELPKPPAPEPAGAPPPAPAPEAAVAPPVGTPAPLLPAKLTRLAPQQVERVVQPSWSADGKQVIFYDQPRPGQGGTWAIDVASGVASHVRPEWGIYTARGSLLAVPDPPKRQSWIKHTGSGAEWMLPSAGPVFSPDATVVAYARDGGLTVAGADDQGARRVSLPISGATVLAWLPGTDGSANGRLLLYGRSGDGAGLFAHDLGTRRTTQLARSRRLPGYSLSPDGTWLAHAQFWNANPAENGLWLTRTDGGVRRKLPVMGSARWTADNRLMLLPHRTGPADSHQVWEVNPATGALRRLVGPEQARFRVANSDWDCSPDGTQIVFVSAEDRGVWKLDVPQLSPGAGSPEGAALPEVPDPQPAIARAKPYRLPFEKAPSPGGWYVSQWYGVTTAGYRWRISSYGQGQGIHFGIDFAAPMRTPVVAIAGGRVIAVDGDYGSAPHNVVIELFDGNQAVYGHLAERSRHVEVGQEVQQGDVVGLSGDSGYPYDGSRNPHLHLEIRKQGRTVATNPVPFFDANWDDMSLGVWNAALFERDLDNPRRYQFLDEQPEIRFGGPIISNFARPWPPA